MMPTFRPLAPIRRPASLADDVVTVIVPTDARTFVIATHDMDVARSFCTNTLSLDQGCVVASGDSETVVERYLDARR